jgi:hypothetical protein
MKEFKVTEAQLLTLKHYLVVCLVLMKRLDSLIM